MYTGINKINAQQQVHTKLSKNGGALIKVDLEFQG